MNRLDQFLRVAARQMRSMPAALRDDELRELRGHLEQRAEDYRDAGMSDDAAQVRALESLGSPRKLGAQLCDAWEGIAWSWWRLVAAIIGVTAFLMLAGLALIMAFSIVPTNAEIALFPEVVPVLFGLYLALPLCSGLLFSHWLGRRGCLVATLYFLVLALAKFTVTFPTASQSMEAPPAFFSAIANAAWFPYFWIALAFTGARLEQNWRTQTRTLATAGAHAIEGKRLFRMQCNLKLWRGALLLLILLGALYPLRVWLQFHPQTPRATLKNHLLAASPQGFAAPEILVMRQLPPASEAERSGREQRFYFRVAASAKPYFAANQIKHLQREISVYQHDKYGHETISSEKALLERVKNNRQIIEGEVRLMKTPNGWKVDDKSFDFIVLWKWFYY